MTNQELQSSTESCGKLKPSLRCYHWLFVWLVIMTIWVAGIIKRGATADIWIVLAVATVAMGYMFFIDMSDRIRWTADQICQRAWEYLSLKPMRHTVRIRELTKVATALHPANLIPGKPFDRILLISPSEMVTIQPSFHRREELEKLLRLVQAERPDTISDPNVIEFMESGFTDWWPYRR